MTRGSIKSYNNPHAKSKGKGWYERQIYLSSINRKVAPKHRKAALSGLDSRYGSITPAQVHKKMERRSKRSQLIDRSKQAKHVGNINKKRDRVDWAKHPESMDLWGVDTEIASKQYHARLSKRELKEKKIVASKIRRQIRKKKEQVKKVKKPEEKQRLQKEIKQKEKEENVAKLDIKNVEVGHQKLRKSIHERSEEKQEVKYIMKATDNNNYIECNALRERALNNGVDYDRVDWDRLQGADLTYNDRVRRLDRLVGKTYTNEELSSSLEEEKYNEMYKDWAASQGYDTSTSSIG